MSGHLKLYMFDFINKIIKISFLPEEYNESSEVSYYYSRDNVKMNVVIAIL